MNRIGRPYVEDAPSFCAYFFDLTASEDLMEALESNKQATLGLINAFPLEKEEYRYEANKWTVKMVFIHLIDTERYYTYRAFCSSRKVDIPLEFSPLREIYALNSNAENRRLKDIAAEFLAVRASTMSLFSSMTNEMLDFKDFPGKPVYTARSLGWMAVGHNIHHARILKEKYLV